MIDYCAIVDKAMGHSMYQHRTLRTCLDPGSAEWEETSMDEKIEIIKKVSQHTDLDILLIYYKAFYREMNKEHVADNTEGGLVMLLNYSINKN